MAETTAEPAAGLFHDRQRAVKAAEELATRDVHAVVRDGMREAEHGYLLKMAVGGLLGGVVMLPFALAFAWFAWQHVPDGIPVWVALCLVAPPIVFCGVYVGIVVGLSLGERAVNRPEILLLVPGEDVAAGKVDRGTVEAVVREQGGRPIKGSGLRLV